MSSETIASMKVRERIHIAPLGFEFDRIFLPAVQFDADRVILLEYLAPDIEKPSYHDELPEKLEDEGIDCIQYETDIFDLYESISKIAELASTFDEHNVYVNLSSGSKVTAIAGMIACMATEAAEPYYVRAETYTSDLHTPTTKGMELVMDIPTYRMDHPEPQQIAILNYIHRVKTEQSTRSIVSKSELIDFAEEETLPFIQNYSGNTKKGKYRLLRSHIIDPLRERGFIEVSSAGTRNDISLTEDGENTLKAFRYLLNSTSQ